MEAFSSSLWKLEDIACPVSHVLVFIELLIIIYPVYLLRLNFCSTGSKLYSCFVYAFIFSVCGHLLLLANLSIGGLHHMVNQILHHH